MGSDGRCKTLSTNFSPPDAQLHRCEHVRVDDDPQLIRLEITHKFAAIRRVLSRRLAEVQRLTVMYGQPNREQAATAKVGANAPGSAMKSVVKSVTKDGTASATKEAILDRRTTSPRACR